MPKLRTEHPWTQAILDLLEDGEWHDYRETIRVGSALVPEEQAFTKAEYYRNYHYTKRGDSPCDRRYGDRDDTVKTGQRFIVSKCLQSLAKRGKVELSYDKADARSRRRPVAVRLAGTNNNTN